MSDDNGKLDLTRRKVLGGLGGVGAGAALGGTGTMAFLSDTETSENNSVTAGQLDLKLDWHQKHYQGKKRGWDGDQQGLTNNPGPIFEVEDAKPGDCGYGYISVHNYHNPAYVWAGCDLKEWEMGRDEPEYHVDDTPKDGELAENIKVALLRYPYVEDTDAEASKQTDVHSQIEGELTGARNFGSLGGCTPLFVTTLADLCKNSLHNGHLLDGRPKKKGRCFYQSHTYFYGFAWWIPTTVGNEIQSDKARFDLKFGAVQCRHVDNPEEHNPFAKTTTDTGDGFAKIAREFNGEGTSSAGARARYGNNASSGAWELGVGDEPGASGEFVESNYTWTSGQTVDWTVSYDASSDELSFTFDGNTISDTLDNPQPDGRMAIQGKADEATVESSIDSLSIGGSSVTLNGPNAVTATNDGSGRQIRHLVVDTALDGSTDFVLEGEATVTLQGDYPGGEEDVAFDVVFE